MLQLKRIGAAYPRATQSVNCNLNRVGKRKANLKARIPAAGGALPLLLSSKSVFRFCLGEAELIVYSL
ncbi:hypothetical protein PC123_g6558 [Phytophthora cactorum]|nr:hypothetical protein PC123_g6558 [Phytophthora cactorum]